MLPSAAATALLLLLSLGPASGRQLQQAAPAAESSGAAVPAAPLPTRVGVWASFFPLLYQDPANSNNYVGEQSEGRGWPSKGPKGLGGRPAPPQSPCAAADRTKSQPPMPATFPDRLTVFIILYNLRV